MPPGSARVPATAAPPDLDSDPLDEHDLKRWRACARRQWLHAHGQPAAGSPADALRAAEARAALRAAFPGAQHIGPPPHDAGWAEALARTAAWLQGPPAAPAPGTTDAAPTLLGACFASDDGVRVQVDVLQRGGLGWRLFRLRLGTVAEDADVDALALWAHAVARAGWRMQSAGLLLVDTDFVYPGLGCHAGLLREVDAGPLLGSRPVAEWLVALRRSVQGSMPAMSLLAPCTREGGCEHLARCHADEPAAPAVPPQQALELVGRELAEQLRVAGHRRLPDVPLALLSQPRHRRIWQAVQQGRPVREPAAAAIVRAWPRPWRFLRIETIGMAVPAWPGTRPYEILPFQWTGAWQTGDGAPLQWQGFLAEPAAAGRADPRRALAERLLAWLAEGAPGTLLAYNAGFERNRLRELARRFDDLAPALDAAADRLVDVFQLCRAQAYHPAQAGSWSARAMYRAVAPELGAHQFDEAGCRSPVQAFGRAMQPGLPAAQAQALRGALSAHGRRQCQALAHLVAWLADLPPPPLP